MDFTASTVGRLPSKTESYGNLGRRSRYQSDGNGL